MSHFASPLAILGLLVGGPAFAQSAPDLPDDIFSDDVEPASPSEERRELLTEEPEVELPDSPKKKRIIQTLQRKNFMKIGRYEFSPHVGFVTNDPFVNRYLFGGSFAYHITEVLGVEVTGGFSPDRPDDQDWKVITRQLFDNNNVSPDISKINAYANLNFQFSPVYGKLALGGGRIINFDVFGSFGTGIVYTVDDERAFGAEDPNRDSEFFNTNTQVHPSLNYGFGARIILSETFAIRAEGRGLSYVEVLESTSLEMKNTFALLASASLFFPRMQK